MKKKLFISIFLSFSVFLGIALLLEFYIINTQSSLLADLLVVLSLLICATFIFRHLILKIAINQLNNFADYISKKILNIPMLKSREERMEEEVFSLFKQYGYSYEEISQGLERISESSQIRKDFTANVSHELKSPLTSINGYAEMISSGMAKGEDAQEFASRILNEGHRLLSMIDEIIQLSRIDNNQIKTESFVEFDLGKTIDENIETFNLQAKDKKVEISFEYQPIIYLGNEKLIFEMVRNLISNAIKYSKTKGGFLNIYVADKETYIELKFEDNGIGISQEDQERIFERFYVVDKSRSNKKATGLGLALVKNIALLHDGSVNVQSSPGTGSVFTVELSKKIK